MSKEYKVDIFELLTQMDLCNSGFYDTLDADQKKAFQPWLAMRYASSSKSEPEHHLIFVNELVNKDFNTLREHPKLQWMLLSMVGLGKSKRYDHPFIKPMAGKKKDKLSEMILPIYPWMNEDELSLFVETNEKTDLISLLEGFGYEEKDIKKAVK